MVISFPPLWRAQVNVLFYSVAMPIDVVRQIYVLCLALDPLLCLLNTPLTHHTKQRCMVQTLQQQVHCTIVCRLSIAIELFLK